MMLSASLCLCESIATTRDSLGNDHFRSSIARQRLSLSLSPSQQPFPRSHELQRHRK